jgi:hypothetical protein
MKNCKKCKEDKSLSDFGKNKREKSGLATICKPCNVISVREWRQCKREEGTLPEYYTKNYKGGENGRLLRTYGITLDDWNNMFSEQEGKCKICNVHQSELKSKLDVDHCHATSEVRGLLCRKCNKAIGLLKDDVERLKAAIIYLEGDEQ